MYHTELFNAYPSRAGQFRGPAPGRADAARQGFTLLEFAIVFVIMGALIAVGVGSWVSMTEGRRIAKTVSDMAKVKECLVRRVYFSERYPTYSSPLDCSGSYSRDYDVDECLCEVGIKDAWDGDLYFLEGVTSAANGLNGKALVANKAEGIESRATPSGDSRVTDHTGKERQDVAFVLISWGENGNPDSASYGDRLTTSQANFMGSTQPDFEANHDDIYLVVTSRELLTALKR